MNPDTLDLNLLRVLDAVLATRSLTQAAERLHVTPPAISNAMARLRELLGDPLMVRQGRRMLPTPLAQLLQPQVALAVRAARGVFQGAHALQAESAARSFTLACADLPHVLQALAQALRHTLPRCTLRVVTLDHAIATRGLDDGSVDLLLALPPELPADLRAEAAFHEPLVMAMDRSHPLARRRRLTLDDYLAHAHVEVALQGRWPIDLADSVLVRQGHQRRVALSVPWFSAAAHAVVDSPWLTLLPQRLAFQLSAQLPLALRPAPLALPDFALQLVWHRRADGDALLAQLRALVRQAGQGNAPPRLPESPLSSGGRAGARTV